MRWPGRSQGLGWRRVAAATALTAAAATACVFSGSERAAKPLTEAQLAELVVMPADVEAALADSQMTQFDSGRLTANDAVAGPREDLGRLGRRAGWKSRYRRADPAAKRGVLVVESRVDEFGDGKGAEADLAGYTSELEQVVRAQGGVLGRDVPVVGSETVTSAYQQKALGGTVHYITVVWRHGRLTASVTVSGFEGTTMDHALALARRVQRRMDEAA